MRRLLLACVVAALSLGTASAQVNPTPPARQEAPAQLQSFDLSILDRNVDACTDFYQFACGGWIAGNPIPPDQSAWGRFQQLALNNQLIERDILEKAAAASIGRDANEQKIGDYYASCMDEDAIEKQGLAPLKPQLDGIAKIQSKAELPEYLATAHLLGVNAFFEFGSEPDFKDSNIEIAVTDQGGLGLPDRDYYLKDDPRSVELRENYVKHARRMFELAGEVAPAAETKAKVVLAIETALAKASMDRVSRRDPANVYHKMSMADLARLSPLFDWKRYAIDTNAPTFDSLNVSVPGFVSGFNEVLANAQLADIKTYLTWRLLSAAAPALPRAFVNENFNFYGKTLTGAKEIRPRWKRCVSRTDAALGEALGKAYVDRTFSAGDKQRMLAMVHAIEQALGRDLQELSWMTAATKKEAQIKLAAVENKIGYPDHWRDYTALQVVRGDALGNLLRGNEFEQRRQIAKIGAPVDRTEWSMTPPTVNAYYNPQENNINFPAGILQPPFYDRRDDEAVNFGGIGAVIGHELTHGFDDQGRQFDAHGNFRNWWTAEDAKAFEQRAQCLVDEYNNFVPIDDLHVNGKLTLGENTADNGGVRLSLMALKAGGDPGKTVAGFTPEQQFFVSFGQIWCTNITPEAQRLRVRVDPHSPAKYRVNGVLSNMPEFQKAFSCKPGSPMVRQQPCRVW